jgi:thymidylate synthase
VKQYLNALNLILKTGENVEDRTGVGTRTVFGHQMRFNLQEGFPAVTTKKLAWRSVVGELLWFLEGSTDERRLAEITFEKPREELVDKKTIWTANADAQGVALGYQNDDLYKELGPVYGSQW